MSGRLIVVVGGQFGSEAKGHVAAQLAAREDADLVIRTGGPNAGHTVYGRPPVGDLDEQEKRQQFKLRQLPTSSVSNPGRTVAIAARSLIDAELLWEEMRATGTRKVLIDPAATMLTEAHRLEEETDPDMQWGSTKEGIGAARADRIHRTAITAGQFYAGDHPIEPHEFRLADVAGVATEVLHNGGTVLIEAAQGYGLGLHTPYYPKTTSADCRAIDALADVGLSPWAFPGIHFEVWVVIRPYPIRVAGESGELKGETTWQELGLPEERTTVTNKVRRVGHWDAELVRAALRANGAPTYGIHGPSNVRVALTMVDQVIPGLAGYHDPTDLYDADPDDLEQLALWIHTVRAAGGEVGMITTSPVDAVFGIDTRPIARTLAGFLNLDPARAVR